MDEQEQPVFASDFKWSILYQTFEIIIMKNKDYHGLFEFSLHVMNMEFSKFPQKCIPPECDYHGALKIFTECIPPDMLADMTRGADCLK